MGVLAPLSLLVRDVESAHDLGLGATQTQPRSGAHGGPVGFRVVRVDLIKLHVSSGPTGQRSRLKIPNKAGMNGPPHDTDLMGPRFRPSEVASTDLTCWYNLTTMGVST
jgi:hypothetical protein